MANNTSLTRLTDRAKLWVTKALKDDQSQHGESVVWEVSVAVFPDPSATVPVHDDISADPSALVPLPALVIYLEIPGADPGESLYIAPIIAPYLLDEERVRKTVNRALKSMRTRRQLASVAP